MVRQPLGPADRQRGLRLGAALRDARGRRSMVEVAARAGISVETVRKIERGRVPTPAFFTVVALADAVGLPVSELCRIVADDVEGRPDVGADAGADVGAAASAVPAALRRTS